MRPCITIRASVRPSVCPSVRLSVRPWVRHAFLGSGLGRGRSPVEWGDFPSIRPSPPSLAGRPSDQAGRFSDLTARSSDLAGRPSDLAGRPSNLAWSWLGDPQGLLGGKERMYGWMDGKSPHSTGLCPLPGPLPKKSIN